MAWRAGRGTCHTFRGLPGLAALVVLAGVPARAQQAPSDVTPDVSLTLPPVTIIGASPLLGSGVDRDTVPAATNVLKGDDLTRGGTDPPDLVRALNEQVGGVNLDSASGNPYQPTCSITGSRHRPLQGTPQGLAVYVNGVRFNQAFGDTVNFDLLPDMAIDQMNLEGSNPVFGLNALGGALNVQLKNGFTYHGGEIEPVGRLVRHVQAALPVRQAERRYRGLCRGKRAAPGRLARSAIFRHLENFYGDIGWRGDTGEVHFNILAANTVLNGPGTSPVELLAADPAAQFTGPNGSATASSRSACRATWISAIRSRMQAVTYYNNFLQRVTNGNAPNDTPCNDGSGLLCSDSGYPARRSAAPPSRPSWTQTRSLFGTRQPDDEHQRLRRLDPGDRHADLFGLQQPSGCRRQLRRRADRVHRQSPISAASRPSSRVFIGPGVIIDEPGNNVSRSGGDQRCLLRRVRCRHFQR